MAIKIPSPSMVFNHNLAKLAKYRMDETFNVTDAASIEMHVKKKTENAPFKSVVLNAHGWPAHVYYGSMAGGEPSAEQGKDPYYTVNWDWINRISDWRYSNGDPRVGTIWITSCDIISFTGPKDGNLFCGYLAKKTGARVIGSNAKHSQGGESRHGYIDSYKGDVWIYYKDGSNRAYQPKEEDD